MKRTAALTTVTIVTLIRVPAVFLFLVAALYRCHGGAAFWAIIALLSLALGSLTDLFDGWLARRWKVSTRFGAHADPLADKAFYLVALPTLVYLVARRGDWMHALIVLVLTVLFLFRDQWVSFLRAVGSGYGVDARANWSGKLRTAISFPFICLLYVDIGLSPLPLSDAVWYAAEAVLIGLNVLSLAIYTRRYAAALRRALAEEPEEG